MSLSAALLVSFVTCETVRTIYAYHALHVSNKITPPLVTLASEVLKIAIATIFICRPGLGFQSLFRDGESSWKTQCLRSSIPATLFLVNTLVFYTVLPLVSPTLLTICILAKLPITAILYHVRIRKQRNIYAWTSLFWLCVGITLFNIKSSEAQEKTVQDQEKLSLLAPIAGLFIAFLGSMASIQMEILVKTGDFWHSQFWLYMWGVILSLVSYPVSETLYAMTKTVEEEAEVPFEDYVYHAAALVVITGGTGLVVGAILRKKDNLLKLVGTSATLISTAVAQNMLLPVFSDTKFEFWNIFGGGLVVVTTWTYNFYQNQPWQRKSSTFRPKCHTAADNFADEESGLPLQGPPSSDLREFVLTEIESCTDKKSSQKEQDFVGEHNESHTIAANSFDIQAPDSSTTYFDPDATKVTCMLLIVTFLAIQTL